MTRKSLLILELTAALWVAPIAAAHASEVDVDVDVEVDDDDDDDAEEVVEVTEYTHSHHRHQHWTGIQFGTILTPHKIRPGVRPTRRVTSNQARACLNPTAEKYCGNVRGFDMRLNFFSAGGTWKYPRWKGYFRTGYTAGRLDFEPRDVEAGYERGDARSISYLTVPLFLGGSVYLFKRSPVRPFGGFGFGLDVLKMQYARHDQRSKIDTSARVGFELHAGIEARISNYVAVTGEVMQLWSARRRLKNAPDFSNEGLTFIVGVSVNFPTWTHRQTHKHVKRVIKTKKSTPPDVRVEVNPMPVAVPAAPSVPQPPVAPTAPAAEVNAEPPPPAAPPSPPPAVAPPPGPG